MQITIIIIFISLMIAIPFVFYGGARLILNHQKNDAGLKKNIYTKKSLLHLLVSSFSMLFVLIAFQFALRNISSTPKPIDNKDSIETIVDVHKRIITLESYTHRVENYLFYQNVLIYMLIGLTAGVTLISLVYIIISLPIPLDVEEKQDG